MTSPPARILIVDDHPLVREGLAMRISTEPDLEVCGDAAAEDEAIAQVERLQPDLMIVDLALQQGHGLELIKRTKKSFPSVRMLVLSGFQESLYAERALRAGAMGYVDKQRSNDAIIDAIRTVLRGERFVGAELAARFIAQALGPGDDAKQPIERLTSRELEIFRLIGEGLATGAIANRLHISTHTIDTHRDNIKRKLGVKTGSQLNRLAVQWTLELD